MNRGSKRGADLVLRKITVTHYFVHVCYAAGDGPRGVCDVWRVALNVEINALRASPGGIGKNVAGIWRAVARRLDCWEFFGDGRVDGGALQANLDGDWGQHRSEVGRGRREEGVDDSLFAWLG
jgi:hypothetical protein